MRLTKKRADNGRYYLSGLAEVSNSYPKGYGRIQVGHAVDKLAEYEDSEEQNRLIKLPCAVGDTVYVLEKLQTGRVMICQTTADSFYCAIWALDGKFGKYIFPTYAEAEAALKELESGKGE